LKPLLITPSIQYITTYREALHEFILESEYPSSIVEALSNLPAEIERLQNLDKSNAQSRAVPQSVLWLMSDEKYVGTIIIRHQASGRTPEIASHIYYEIRPSERGKGYGTLMLRLGLAVALRLGIKHPILSCYEDNVASLKIIEANGGRLLERHVIADSEGERVMFRFEL
jgi:predicted acetyltransferase